MMKSTILLALLSLLPVLQARGQLYQGPDTGSIAWGVTVTTDTYSTSSPATAAGNIRREPRNEEEIELITPLPANVPGPTAPEGSNYRIDPSVTQGVLGVPPFELKSFQGIPDLGVVIPPDPYLAAGPDQVIAVVNQRFRIIDKQGTTLKTIDAPSWFAGVYQNNGAFDPKVLYDHFANRWVMVWLQQSDTGRTSHYLLSVSDGPSALGTWYNWALPAGVNGNTVDSTWADYEGVGFDENAIYISSNQWTFGSSASFQYAKVRIIPKAQLYGHSAGPVTWTDFWDLRDPSSMANHVGTVRPARIYGSPGVYYLVCLSPFSPGTYVNVFRLSDPLGSPTITGVSVPVTSWTPPPNADQLGGSTIRIEIGGASIKNEPVYRDSSLWIVHCVASGTSKSFSSIRYVRINTVSNTATEDMALGADNFWSYYPALAVDKDDNLAITFSRSGTTEYAGAYMTWRLKTDPAGSLRPSVTIQPGLANYVKDFGGGRNRWGDYNGAWLDPVDQNDFWMFSEYTAASNTWGTWFYNVRLVPFPGPRAFASVDSIGFGKLEVGHPSDTSAVTITNYGSSPLNVTNISVSQPSYNILNLPAFPKVLQPLDSINLGVYFLPGAHGVVADSLTIASNDTVNAAIAIPLSGKGVLIGTGQPGIMYAASSPPASQLFSLNYANGSVSPVGSFGIPEVQSITIRPSTKELYGSESNTTQTVLYRISAGFGDVLQLSVIPTGSIRAIAFNQGDSLYAISSVGNLYLVNPLTGTDTLVGKSLGLSPSSIAFKPRTDQLWCGVKLSHFGNDRIFTLDITSGAATIVGGTGMGATVGLAFGAAGNLYGLVGLSPVTLIAIDTATGAGATIGSTGMSGLSSITMRTDTLVVAVREEAVATLPAVYALGQNYPNPFNPSTVISYQLAAAGNAKLVVYDILGRAVATLVNERKSAGKYMVMWDAGDVASGVYFYKLTAGTFVETKKMMVIK